MAVRSWPVYCTRTFMEFGFRRCGAGFLETRWNNAKTADANRPWAEYPDGIRVATHGRRDRNIAGGGAEYACDPIRCDAVGHQGGDPALARELGIQRTELDEPIKGVSGGGAQVDPVWHA